MTVCFKRVSISQYDEKMSGKVALKYQVYEQYY